METIEKIMSNLGAADIDSRLEEQLIDGILYAFQEQTTEVSVTVWVKERKRGEVKVLVLLSSSLKAHLVLPLIYIYVSEYCKNHGQDQCVDFMTGMVEECIAVIIVKFAGGSTVGFMCVVPSFQVLGLCIYLSFWTRRTWWCWTGLAQLSMLWASEWSHTCLRSVVPSCGDWTTSQPKSDSRLLISSPELLLSWRHVRRFVLCFYSFKVCIYFSLFHSIDRFEESADVIILCAKWVS